MWLTLSDTLLLYWQSGNVNIRVLVVKMKWDYVYKALKQACLSDSIDKLLLDVVIIKFTGALLIASILNSKRGSFKCWRSLRSYDICKVGISLCVEIRCCWWTCNDEDEPKFTTVLTQRPFSVTHWIFTFQRELHYEIYLFVTVWPAKQVIFWEDFPVIDPPLVKKKHFFLVVPPIGNVDIALFFMVGEVSGYSA